MIAEELIFQRPVSTMFMSVTTYVHHVHVSNYSCPPCSCQCPYPPCSMVIVIPTSPPSLITSSCHRSLTRPRTLRYDALWTLPAYDFIMDWQSTMFRAPIEVNWSAFFSEASLICSQKVPYVWSPFFHDLIARLSPERPKYSPREAAKTIAIFEPNLYIVKNFVMPLAMIEKYYRYSHFALPTLLRSSTNHSRRQTISRECEGGVCAQRGQVCAGPSRVRCLYIRFGCCTTQQDQVFASLSRSLVCFSVSVNTNFSLLEFFDISLTPCRNTLTSLT